MARNGLPWAAQLVLEAEAALRYCLAVVRTTFCPERIVMGGGRLARIEVLEPDWVDRQFEAARAQTIVAARAGCQLVKAQLGAEAVLFAAPRLLRADVGPPGKTTPGTAEKPSR